MNKKEKLAFAVVAALAMTSGGFAFGQSVNNVSSDQVIYACVTGVNGNITKVSNTPKTCPKGTTPISWNMAGPKGDQGFKGLDGLKGERGEQGKPGIAADNPVPTTYFVSPTGTKIPVYIGVLAKPAIFYKGAEYQLFVSTNGSIPTVAVGTYGLIDRSGELWFTTPDCSGQSYVVSGYNQQLYFRSAYFDQNIGRVVSMEQTNLDAKDIISSRARPGDTCQQQPGYFNNGLGIGYAIWKRNFLDDLSIFNDYRIEVSQPAG